MTFISLLSSLLLGIASVMAGAADTQVYMNGYYLDTVSQNSATYVSTEPFELTELNQNGYLAHNWLAGKLFYDLKIGDEVVIIRDGKHDRYSVTEILQYQVLDNGNNIREYVNLSSGEWLTETQLFERAYKDGKTTYQTCIKRGDNWSWGRLFLITSPSENVLSGTTK